MADTNIDNVLSARGRNYGSFRTHAIFSQGLKEIARTADGYDELDEDMKEAIEMIMHKVARILNGNPSHVDSWIDIAGYAKLVADRLNGKEWIE